MRARYQDKDGGFEVQSCALCVKRYWTLRAYVESGGMNGMQHMPRAEFILYCLKCKCWICGTCAYPEWTRLRALHGAEKADSATFGQILSDEYVEQYGRIPAPSAFDLSLIHI